MTKSGRYRNVTPPPPSVTPENFAALTSLHIQKRVVNTVALLPPGTFTSDDFIKHYPGNPDYDFAFAALSWLVTCGVVEKSGLMHWRRKA